MRIMIVKERNETRYIDVSTDELWAKASLAILTDRFNRNWFQDPNETGSSFAERNEEDKALLAMNEDLIKVLPSAVQISLRTSIRAANARILDHSEDQFAYDEIKKVVENKDISFVGTRRHKCPVAWTILESQDDYISAGVEIVEVESLAVEVEESKPKRMFTFKELESKSPYEH